MSSPMIQKDGVGTLWDLTIVDQDGDAVDISGASTKQYVFEAPDATTLTVDAVFNPTGEGDGTDGKLRWVGTGEELDQLKWWKWQAKVVLDDATYWSSIQTYYVEENLGS